MKITFILPDFNYVKEYMSDYRGSSSLGVGYLSACLKKAGHKTSLLHMTNEKIEKNEFLKLLKQENPSLIAFTSFTHQFPVVKKWVSWARELKKPIICGGVHPTIAPEDAIKAEGIDFICVGEGEEAIVELCNKLEKSGNVSKIKNLWVKKGRKIIKNPVRMLVENLDLLPFADKEIFDIENIADGTMGVLTVIATRGCPYQCSYCCNHQYQKIYHGKGAYVRYRTVDNVIEELRKNKERYPFLRYVELLDDSFVLKKEWVLEFCEKYKKYIGMPFRANTRIDLLDDETLSAMKNAGCERLAMGIESGNEKVRQNILNRHVSNEQIIRGFNLCRKHNIETVSYNMVGTPFETIENVLDTVKLNAQIRPNSIHLAIFQPYPHTRLYDLCIEKGFIKGNKISTFFGESVLKQPSISEKEVRFAYKYFLIFVKVYSTIGNAIIFEKMLDKLFCSKKMHGFMLKMYPLAFFLTNPVLASYRLSLKLFPNFTRIVKRKITGRY